MEPLASIYRPTSFEEVIGQEKVVSIIEKMLKENHLISMILYGPTGCGKTTIALLISNHFPLNHFKFNASTDNKQTLRTIIDSSKHYGSVLLIVDEIHRMNKDIQDYLLPYVETGQVIMVGLTTENPYIACNPAIRSRVTIFKLNRPSEEDIKQFLKKIDISSFHDDLQIEEEVYEYIAELCNGEVRSGINMLELLLTQATNHMIMTLAFAKEVISKPSLSLDKNGNHYYDILSAFHKSVRGSDCNGALHYLARLIVMEDLESILRRISAIVYEDIGLANPSMGPKVAAACDICRHIGFPEAVNALGAITIEMCLSPKSNSAHLAINQAIEDVASGKTYPVPSHLINNPTYDDKLPYLYAHDFPNHIVKQDYLPKELQGKTYYNPQDHTKLEQIFKEQYQKIEAILHPKKERDQK